MTALPAEYVFHGGGIFTRAEVYRLESQRADLPAHGIGSPEWWAFHGPAVDVAAMTARDFRAGRSIARYIIEEDAPRLSD